MQINWQSIYLKQFKYYVFFYLSIMQSIYVNWSFCSEHLISVNCFPFFQTAIHCVKRGIFFKILINDIVTVD